VRRKGNLASYEASFGTTLEAKTLLQLAYRLSTWFLEVYIYWNFKQSPYIEPEPEQESSDLQNQLEQKISI
jgi:type I restriction enzyme, R subunit